MRATDSREVADNLEALIHRLETVMNKVYFAIECHLTQTFSIYLSIKYQDQDLSHEKALLGFLISHFIGFFALKFDLG